MTKISTLSDQPFSFPPKNVIFWVKIMKFLIPGQNFGIFASPTKGMDTFLFEMSMKWMFTFKNFRNVYWHGKTHSAMDYGRLRWAIFLSWIWSNTCKDVQGPGSMKCMHMIFRDRDHSEGRGVNGHLEPFRKFIRFGSVTRPLHCYD